MASWLKPMSAVFVVAGIGGGAYALLQDRDREYLDTEAAKLRPVIDQFVDQGKDALHGLVESETQRRAPAAEVDTTKLPFIIIEPRDFAAPIIKLPVPPQAQPQAPAAKLLPDPDSFSGSDSAMAMDLNPVEARLRARVSAELFGYFDLYLYISKATSDKGDWAQRMFVLAKSPDPRQSLMLLHHWAVSTGLEEAVLSPSGAMLGTDTPQGVFKLDRDRFHEDYTSNQWQSAMPHAMFFDWRINGRTSGLAIHGTDEEGVKKLGERASHGCIRLAPENARMLFELIQTNYRGRVPRFQIDPDSGTMSTTGALARDDEGNVKMTSGYTVLVFIEDHGGPSVDTVAALY